jgi:hypothetical protein
MEVNVQIRACAALSPGTAVPTEQEAVRTSDPVWTIRRRETIYWNPEVGQKEHWNILNHCIVQKALLPVVQQLVSITSL